jgi:hypothetical protein
MAQTLVYTVTPGAFTGRGNYPAYIRAHHALTFWWFPPYAAAFILPMKEGLSPEDSLGRTHYSERKSHDPTLTTHGLFSRRIRFGGRLVESGFYTPHQETHLKLRANPDIEGHLYR